MKIYNNGAGAVITSKGRLDPKKFEDVPDAEAKKLLGMYDDIKNAHEMIGEKEPKKTTRSAVTMSPEVAKTEKEKTAAPGKKEEKKK